MNNIIDFTTKLLGLQDIEVVHTDVNNGNVMVYTSLFPATVFALNVAKKP